MSEEIWTIIKYKPKEGCEDKFVEGLKRLEQIIEKSKAGQEFQNKFNTHMRKLQTRLPLFPTKLLFTEERYKTWRKGYLTKQ